MFFELFLQLARSSQIKMQYARKPMLETKVICTVCPDNMKKAEPVRLNREQASKQAFFWFRFPCEKADQTPNYSKAMQLKATEHIARKPS